MGSQDLSEACAASVCTITRQIHTHKHTHTNIQYTYTIKRHFETQEKKSPKKLKSNG